MELFSNGFFKVLCDEDEPLGCACVSTIRRSIGMKNVIFSGYLVFFEKGINLSLGLKMMFVIEKIWFVFAATLSNSLMPSPSRSFI